MPEFLEGYRVFYVTAQAGSFTKAAERLYITQPAVTQAVKQLEARLGGQLFFRTSKGVKLTAEGEVLFRYVEQAFHIMDAGERQLSDMHSLQSGEIRIGAGDTLCKHVLLPCLARFREEYPAVRIQVANRTTAETIGLLKAGRIDLGIVNLPVRDQQLEVWESIGLQDCFVVGEKYRFLAGGPVPLRELVRHPVLLLENGSSIRGYLNDFAQAQGVQLEPEIELGSLDLLADFARSGFGVAQAIRNFIGPELSAGGLHEVQLEPPVPARRVGVIRLKDVPLTTAAKRFAEMLPLLKCREE